MKYFAVLALLLPLGFARLRPGADSSYTHEHGRFSQAENTPEGLTQFANKVCEEEVSKNSDAWDLCHKAAKICHEWWYLRNTGTYFLKDDCFAKEMAQLNQLDSPLRSD